MEAISGAGAKSLGMYVNPCKTVHRIWQQRELIAQLTAREIAVRYRGTYLGVLWSLITPLLMLLIYTLVFSIVLKVKWSDADQATRLDQFALTLFAGLIPFTVFSEVVTRAPTVILSVPNYVKKVVFPLEVLRVVVLASALVHSLISVGILLGGVVLFRGTVSPTVVLLPLAYLPLILLCLGLGWFLASLGVYVRDMGPSMGIVVQMLMFLSPIFYPTSAVPAPLRTVIAVNPLAMVVHGFRQTLLWQEALPWSVWAQWTGGTVVLAWCGYVWFMKTRDGFADVL